MMALSVRDIITYTSGHLISGDPDSFFENISTDSRTINKGDLFIALKGDHYNGHRFVGDAITKGARGSLVMEKIESLPGTIISVDDTLVALGDIAQKVRTKYNPKIVGVTGSTGKTTVKELCSSILSLKGTCLKTEKNFNNCIGVPLTLLKLTHEHKFAVIEMGTNRFGEIDRLSSITRPTVSILTNIHPVHLSGLRNISGITREKQAIFKNTASDGFAVINPYLQNMNNVEIPKNLGVITFSQEQKADVTLKSISYEGLDGSDVQIDVAGKIISTHVPLPGFHNVMNALAASACGVALQIEPEIIAEGISKANFPGMRSEIIVSDHITIINDSYNANPESMKAALKMLVSAPHTYKVAVLGDMLELGNDSEYWHVELGKMIALSHIDRLIYIGQMAQIVSDSAIQEGMDKSSIHTANMVDEIKPYLLDIPGKDAMVLVKASRSLHLDQAVSYLKVVA